ncbi:MAG: two-component regulator propeller domain-containing protein, partial [Salinibacter sp.]
RDLVQGPEGYLWVGAERGLRRFDGTTFERLPTAAMTDTLSAGGRVERVQPYGEGVLVRYRDGGLALVTPGRSTLLTEEATAHWIGPDGAIWLGTRRGVSVYRNGAQTRVAPTALRAHVRGLLQTQDGTLWVATRTQGLYRRLPDGDVIPVPDTKGRTAGRVAFAEGPDGTVYVGTETGLYRWTEGRLSKMPAPSSQVPLPIIEIRPDVAGTCWARTPRGVYRCREGRLVPYPAAPAPERRPRSRFVSNDFVFESSKGALYVNTGTTLYRNGRALFETDRFIRSVLHDREGNLWIGTDSEGLVRLRPTPFSVYGEPEGLPGNAVATILERQDGSVWIGGEQGGLTRLDGDRMTVYRPRKAGAPMRHVWTLHEESDGPLWVGGTRLCRFVDGQCARPGADGPTPSTVITGIQDGPRGRLWVGTLRHGLFRRAAGASGSASWTHLTPETSALPGRRVRWMHKAPTGALWFSVYGEGLVRWHEGEMKVLSPDVLATSQPTYIHQDTSGVLWVGTLSSGLRRVDLRGTPSLQNASVTAYRVKDGLLRSTIYQILPDGQGRFWMNTPKGLFWVKRASLNAFAAGRTDQIRSVDYSARDGLRNVEGNSFGTPGAVRTRNGELWFPTMGGAVSVDPADVPVAPAPPPVDIAAVSSSDRAVAVAPDSAVSLASTQRTFRVEYAGLRLRDPTDVTFRYRLVGFQNDWTRATTRQQAFFTKVPPGQYTFEVAARTHLGPWSPEPARLTVSVAPYFYETWWFYGLCAVALGLMGYGGIRYRLYALQRQQARLKEEVAERTQELRKTSAQLEALFERSPDMVKIHDAEGNVLRANPRYSEELGYREEELIGMKIWELDPSISPQEASKLWAGMEIGDRHRFESILRRKDGSTFPVEVHIRRLRLGGDDRFMAISRNITERKEAERELERENERLDRFASVLSHDLRNPLNVAQGRLQLAKEANGNPADHLSSVKDALGRMDEIIEDMLLLTWSEQEIGPEDL